MTTAGFYTTSAVSLTAPHFTSAQLSSSHLTSPHHIPRVAMPARLLVRAAAPAVRQTRTIATSAPRRDIVQALYLSNLKSFQPEPKVRLRHLLGLRAGLLLLAPSAEF